MANIGGNMQGVLQTQSSTKNRIGEPSKTWADAVTLTGWLGLQSGDSKYVNYNAKVQESTHVFLCDYNTDAYVLAGKDTRMIIKNQVYDVMLIDNPDEMDEQLEIYLKLVGGIDAGN
ncbi:MAG: head-tail adaptor protein [Muricomes sp.]